ncbi:MAG: acetolactate decarboxylase [Deltaproteobacteria bacterium]|nr:acetolactate decarboxylase [Deltaproteobacteria bacterium]
MRTALSDGDFGVKMARHIYAALLLICSQMGIAEPGWIYQTAPIAAVMAGLYDGNASCSDVLRRGSNVGVGTFDHLDGEMIVVDGQVYAARQSGKVERLSACSTPFATVASFSADAKAEQLKNLDLAQIEAAVDARMPSLNTPVFIKISGDFAAVTLRVAPRQERPYPKLTEAVKKQPIFERARVTGTMVGFRMPSYVSGINVPGYHFHFISDDHTFAGHVFKLNLVSGAVTLEAARGLQLGIPSDQAFTHTNLAPVSDADVTKVERAHAGDTPPQSKN